MILGAIGEKVLGEEEGAHGPIPHLCAKHNYRYVVGLTLDAFFS